MIVMLVSKGQNIPHRNVRFRMLFDVRTLKCVFSFHTPLCCARPGIKLHYNFGEAFFAMRAFMFTLSAFDVTRRICVRVGYVLAIQWL